MNQAELITAVAERVGLTKADAGKAVEALVGTITEALTQGDEVRISGFGTFGVSVHMFTKPTGIFINPATCASTIAGTLRGRRRAPPHGAGPAVGV